MAFSYVTIDQIVPVHGLTVEFSGGGSVGHFGLGPLEAALEHIQNDDYYPTLDKKLAHLMFAICKFHCFQDGNKRLAIVVCALMLLLNGHLALMSPFINAAENIVFHVATDKISKDLLGRWMQAVLLGEDDDESLKLEIYTAISEE